MSHLPRLSGREAVKVFEKLGWRVARQRGSHIIMIKAEATVTLSIPDHDEIARGTLRSLLRAAGVTVDEFASSAAHP